MFYSYDLLSMILIGREEMKFEWNTDEFNFAARLSVSLCHRRFHYFFSSRGVQYWKLVKALSRFSLSFSLYTQNDYVNWLQIQQHIDLRYRLNLFEMHASIAYRFKRNTQQLNCHVKSQNTIKSYVVRAFTHSNSGLCISDTTTPPHNG